MQTTNYNSTASIMHMSTFSQYLFPFGNFIFPVIIWSSMKEKSEYVDQQGKEVINFQLSVFIYQVVLVLTAIPIFLCTVLQHVEFNSVFHDNEVFIHSIKGSDISGIVIFAIVAVVLAGLLQLFEFFMTILAAVKTSNGLDFKYPLSIKFLK
ncbi:DUF4870 domain-containing protein [Flavobacterium pallidum]|uniref:DUF4870 domain-containing protein n=1 Tax=Flavobacterium pallidum TaxID=2172098 RepID=A0A2S1SHX7_9FLAO|nr:DUF4870 domain-containing protein [Flavobacterium pallidum]AWI26016.1 DUF4870 domain-containing protein [Flavobacterium pallidum]